MTEDLNTLREALEASLVWRASALHKFHRPAVEKALAALSRLEAAAAAEYERGRQDGMKQEHALWQMQRIGQEIEAAVVLEPTRSQKLRDAGYARRPSWRSLPSDADDDIAVPELSREEPVAWREAVLDLIDDCPGLTMEQDHWLSRRVKELDFPSAPPAPPKGWREIMREARDNCEASIAEDGISAMRREYRKELLERMDAMLAAAPQPGDKEN